MPNLFVIGGCNGSGKTTVALNILPNLLKIFEYVNADAIASGLSPLQPETMAIQAGRLMLARLRTLANSSADFAFETTLAARTFVPFLRECQTKNYTINLIYFWLLSPELAIERVARRVASGGHFIPEDTIVRRYEAGRKNLFQLYMPLCDSWIIYDNSRPILKLVAERGTDAQPIIYEHKGWQQITGGING